MFSLVRGLPSTTSASRVAASLVRQLRSYIAPVRLLAGVHARIALLASRAVPGLVNRWMPTRSPGSRACSFSACQGSRTTPGPSGTQTLRCRPFRCGLPVASTRSAPGLRFSKLNSPPADASGYTSPGPSRIPAQDSRSRWFATPFLQGSFIPYCTPVYPGDCARSRARLRNGSLGLQGPARAGVAPVLRESCLPTEGRECRK